MIGPAGPEVPGSNPFGPATILEIAYYYIILSGYYLVKVSNSYGASSLLLSTFLSF